MNCFDDSILFTAALWFHMRIVATVSTVKKKTWGGSPPEKRPNVFCDFQSAHRRLIVDYFWPEDIARDDSSNQAGQMFSAEKFERRFRMPRYIFDGIFSAVGRDCSYLRAGLKPNCVRQMVGTPLQKVVACFRYLAYWSLADSLDEYCRLGESTSLPL